MTRKFYNNDKSWEITSSGNTLTTWKHSKETIKTFDTEEKANAGLEKLVKAKLKAGYDEILLDIPKVSLSTLYTVERAKKTKAKKLEVDVEQSARLMDVICTITSLESLTLSGLKTIPPEIAHLSELLSLYIQGNSLTSIPDEISELSKLLNLGIEYTQLKKLPPSLGKLSNLIRLYIQHSSTLKKLPTSIGQLTNLETLWICHNRETEDDDALPIPKEIGLLPKLTELNLSSNSLTGLPDEISALRNLTELDLFSNQFSTIPSAALKLSKLTRLDIRLNPLETIPLDFCELKNLSKFQYSYHPKGIPLEISENGWEAIQEYLREKKYGTKISLKTIDPAPENSQEIANKRTEKFQSFKRECRDKTYDEIRKVRFDVLVEFISGKTDELPKPHKEDVYYFGPISTLMLNPVARWDFIDHRIITFITQNSFYYKSGEYFDGFYEYFSTWLNQELKTAAATADVYQDILKFSLANDLKEEVLLEAFLDEVRDLPVLDANKKINSLGRYIIQLFKKEQDATVNLIINHKHATDFIALLLQEDEKLLTPVISRFLEIKEHHGMDDNKHIPVSVLDVLCATNAKKYAPEVLKGMQQIDCVPCKAEATRILLDYAGEKYRDLAWDTSVKTLTYISEQKNTKDRYLFNWSLVDSFLEDDTAEYIEWVGKRFGKKALPHIFEYIENTEKLNLNVIRTAISLYGQDAIDIAGEALNMKIKSNRIASHYKQVFNMLEGLDYSKYHDKVWEIVQSEYKDVRMAACAALSKLDEKEVIPKLKKYLLTAKETHLREAGILILSLINTPEALKNLSPILLSEKNETNRNIAVHALFTENKSISMAEAQKRIALADERKKLNKPVVKWLDESKLPNLFWKSTKKELSVKEVRFLLYRQKSQGNEIEKDAEAKAVYSLIENTTSGDFSAALLQLIQNNGGINASNRFALTLVGIFGDNHVITILQEEAIKRQNINACTTLGLIYSLESAKALDAIMQTYLIKYPNVNSAARDAFENIADALELTAFELSDKMIPTLEFKGLEKEILIDENSYKVKITPDLKLTYYNAKGKLVKSIEKASKQQKAEFKEEKKLLKTVVQQLSTNMEHYLVTQRKWTKKDWNGFFLQNPIAFAFVQNFVWQEVQGRKVISNFIVTADGILENQSQEKIELNDKSLLLLVHPVNYSKEALLTYWKHYFKTAAIRPPFSQLDRRVTTVTEQDKENKLSYKYEKTEDLIGYTFKSRAEKKGWKRGSVVDSGSISSYRKAFPNEKIEVFIKTENIGMGFYEEYIQLKEFFFVAINSIHIGSYMYDEPKNEQDHRLISFKDVAPIVYSEALGDLEFMTRPSN